MENQKPIVGRIPPAPSLQQYQNQKPIAGRIPPAPSYQQYISQLGALTEKHVILHTNGAENKMNNALRYGSITQNRMFKQ